MICFFLLIKNNVEKDFLYQVLLKICISKHFFFNNVTKYVKYKVVEILKKIYIKLILKYQTHIPKFYQQFRSLLLLFFEWLFRGTIVIT